MVKVKSPLLSREASGKMSGGIVFSVRLSGQQVRFQRSPIDRQSAGQLSRREIYSNGVDEWHSLTSNQKQAYITQAIELNMTGYNLFMKTFLLNNGGAVDTAIYGVAIYGIAIYGQS